MSKSADRIRLSDKREGHVWSRTMDEICNSLVLSKGACDIHLYSQSDGAIHQYEIWSTRLNSWLWNVCPENGQQTQEVVHVIAEKWGLDVLSKRPKQRPDTRIFNVPEIELAQKDPKSTARLKTKSYPAEKLYPAQLANIWAPKLQVPKHKNEIVEKCNTY